MSNRKTSLDERIAKATKGDFYYKFTGDGKIAEVKITGANRYWNSKKDRQDEIIYISELRIAGLPEVLKDLLLKNEYTEGRISQLFEKAYSKSTIAVGGVAHESYMSEIGKYKEKKESTPVVKTESFFKLSDVPLLHYLVRGRVTVPLSLAQQLEGKDVNEAKEFIESLPSVKKGNKTLAEALETLNENEVYNVSKSVNGKAHWHKIPKPGPASKFKGVQGLSIVSDTAEAYAIAVSSLGSQYANYSAQYVALYGSGGTQLPKTTEEPKSIEALPPILPQLPSTGMGNLPALPPF